MLLCVACVFWLKLAIRVLGLVLRGAAVSVFYRLLEQQGVYTDKIDQTKDATALASLAIVIYLLFTAVACCNLSIQLIFSIGAQLRTIKEVATKAAAANDSMRRWCSKCVQTFIVKKVVENMDLKNRSMNFPLNELKSLQLT